MCELREVVPPEESALFMFVGFELKETVSFIAGSTDSLVYKFTTTAALSLRESMKMTGDSTKDDQRDDEDILPSSDSKPPQQQAGGNVSTGVLPRSDPDEVRVALCSHREH